MLVYQRVNYLLTGADGISSIKQLAPGQEAETQKRENFIFHHQCLRCPSRFRFQGSYYIIGQKWLYHFPKVPQQKGVQEF